MFKDQITNYLKFDKKKNTLNKIDRMILSMIRTKTENKPGVLCIKSLLTLTSLKTRIRVELSLILKKKKELNSLSLSLPSKNKTNKKRVIYKERRKKSTP